MYDRSRFTTEMAYTNKTVKITKNIDEYKRDIQHEQ